jgi:hypothetical protein
VGFWYLIERALDFDIRGARHVAIFGLGMADSDTITL